MTELDIDDIVDSAKAQISLAKMYLTMKDFESAYAHLRTAQAYLTESASSNSLKWKESLTNLNELQTILKEKKIRLGPSRYRIPLF